MTIDARPFTLQTVAYDDPRAVELRRRMSEEMSLRYSVPRPGIDQSPETMRRRDEALLVHPEQVHATVLALDADGTPLAHAVLRDLAGEWEVKRLIVAREARGRGVGRALMAEVERLAREGGARRVILQTGDQQPEAIALYEKIGYRRIPVYEPYRETMPHSLCYEKEMVG